jgi:type I restriction enzyme S subunit
MNIEVKERVLLINKGKIPRGYKKTKLGIIPEGWSKIPFDNIFNELNIKTKNTIKYPLYSLTIENGVIPKSQRYERGFLVQKKEDIYKIVKENDFVFNPMNLRFGAISRYKGKRDICVSGYYNIFHIKQGYISEFFEFFLISKPMINYYNIIATGSLIEKRRVHYSQFKKFELSIPSFKEQYKIAKVLSTCEKIIELKEKLIEQKKLQKKYIMQALLDPKSPNFRQLPGFDKDWGKIKLGECFTERRENNCTLRLLSITSEKGVIDRMEIKHKDNSNEDKSKYKVILKGDIGYNTMRMWQGVSGVSSLTGIVSPAYTVCKPKEEICPEFFGYLFKLQRIIDMFHRHSQGLVNDTLSLKYTPFAKLKFSIPKYEEQKSVVDKEIGFLEKELEQQKLKKKALMQLLLTGKVRVNVS